MKSENRVKVLFKTFSLLEQVACGNRSLKNLAEKTRLNKTTCHRILNSLRETGAITFNAETKQYQIGKKIIEIGLRGLESFKFHQEATPLLRQLRDQISETVNLSVLSGNKVLITARFRAEHLYTINLEVGSLLPLHCTSQGKALLAFSPEPEYTRLLEGIEFIKRTENTITDKNEFLKELCRVREQGYAINNQEFELGVIAVAAPILGIRGESLACINAFYPLFRHPEESFKAELINKVQAICEKLSL